MTNRILKKPLPRVLALVLPAAILAAAVAVGTSFAGGKSYLSKHEALRTFVKKSEAEKQYLTRKEAKEVFARSEDLPQTPVSRVLASSVDVLLASKTPVEIPAARAVFKTDSSTSNVVITFSGQATCTAATNGLGCPIQVLVDGYATDKVNFLTASSDTPQAKESVHTVVRSAIVTPGQHVVSVRYAGATDTSLALKLFDWQLITESYPTGDVVVDEDEE